jgi:hypothetical protein
METDKKSERLPHFLFWRNSLTTKLILLCALIVVVPLVYQSVFSVNTIADGMFRQYSAAMQENISNERKLADNYFNNVSEWTSTITGNQRLFRLLLHAQCATRGGAGLSHLPSEHP